MVAVAEKLRKQYNTKCVPLIMRPTDDSNTRAACCSVQPFYGTLFHFQTLSHARNVPTCSNLAWILVNAMSTSSSCSDFSSAQRSKRVSRSKQSALSISSSSCKTSTSHIVNSQRLPDAPKLIKRSKHTVHELPCAVTS